MKRGVKAAPLGYVALLLITWLGISRWATIAASQPVLADAPRREAVFRALRAAFSDGAIGEVESSGRRWRGRATLWCGGRARSHASLESEGARLRITLDRASEDVALAGCRIQLDVDAGSGPLIESIAPLFALSIVPGVDGLGLRFGEREARLYPDELARDGMLAGWRPLPGFDLELGLDVRAALNHLALAVGADSATWRHVPHTFYRFRVESYVEAAARPSPSPSLPLVRGNPPAPPLSPETLREAARAGARYLVRHLHADGRYDYQYDTTTDQVLPGDDYSLPRHAGATYFLAQAAAEFPSDHAVFAEAAHRALAWLAQETGPMARCDRAAWTCVAAPDSARADLGSAALALLAAVEYREATADPRYADWSARLAAFLLAMQKPDGDYCHLYDLDADRRDEHTHLLYYSGEATFALARYAARLPAADPRRPVLDDAVDRALAWLTVRAYDHFAGGFYYGEDHWTCLALDAAWERLPLAHRERYGDFCEGFARFLDRSRFHPDEAIARAWPDLVGAYGFGPFLAPHPTPVGSRSEALISIHRIAERRGHTITAMRIAAAVRDSMRFLLAHQVRPDGAFAMPDPDAAVGAFLANDAQRHVRIDFVQHAGSAMLRASFVPSLSSPAP